MVLVAREMVRTSSVGSKLPLRLKIKVVSVSAALSTTSPSTWRIHRNAVKGKGARKVGVIVKVVKSLTAPLNASMLFKVVSRVWASTNPVSVTA